MSRDHIINKTECNNFELDIAELNQNEISKVSILFWNH
jgi:hypothetical protein